MKGRYKWVEGHVKDLEPGHAYLARRGTEYVCESRSFAGVVYATAREKGWKATVVTGERWVVFAFYRPDSYMRPNLPAYPIVKKMRREIR